MGIPYIKPNAEHLLGTNDVGQDLFSELIYGTRVSLFIGVFTSLLVTVTATALALLSGYYQGKVDRGITMVTNIMMGLPSLALTTLLIAYLNPGKLSIIISISLTAWPGTCRILRSRVLQLCEMPFVKIEKIAWCERYRDYGQASDPKSEGYYFIPCGAVCFFCNDDRSRT